MIRRAVLLLRTRLALREVVRRRAALARATARWGALSERLQVEERALNADAQVAAKSRAERRRAQRLAARGGR